MTKNELMFSNDKIIDSIKEYEAAFIQLILDRLGIIIRSPQVNDLHKTIVDACQKFQCSPHDYLQILRTCSDESPLLEHLIARVTVGETYFFRDKNQMTLLRENLLPNLIKLKKSAGNLSLRIWSAGCASGEEIFSVVMILNEILDDMKNWTLNILATDINTAALKKGMEGRYSDWSMRSIAEHFANKYFFKTDHHYQLNQKIIDLVKFDYLNLNSDSYPSIFNGTNSQDLILCRNVLIYFDLKRIGQLMQKLSTSLAPGGFLLLGASDPIDIKSTNLIFHHENCIYFSSPMAEKIPAPKTLQPKKPMQIAPKVFIPSIPKQSAKSLAAPKPQTLDPAYIEKLFLNAEWQDILNLLKTEKFPKEKSGFFLTAKATALANLGKLEEAVKVFKESFIAEPTNKLTYFMYALTLTELNFLDQAEQALRKTLFLDHQFVAAHYQLGLLLLRKKQNAAGIKCLHNALSIAKRQSPAHTVPGSPQLSYGRLAEILEYELTLYTLQESEYENKISD